MRTTAEGVSILVLAGLLLLARDHLGLGWMLVILLGWIAFLKLLRVQLTDPQELEERVKKTNEKMESLKRTKELLKEQGRLLREQLNEVHGKARREP